MTADDANVELLPCPFCGGYASMSGEEDYFFAYCTNEGVCDVAPEGVVATSRTEAIAAWNRRPSGWIPCSERMPEKEGRYLVTLQSREDGRVIVDYAWFYKRGVWNKDLVWRDLAWQPLPAAYEPERDDDDE